MSSEPPPESWPITVARLEAKLDVAIAQHGAQLQDHERRLGEHRAALNDHDTRITANALTTAETRSQAATVASDLKTLETRFSDSQSADRNLLPVWIGIAVAAAGLVIGPILSALLAK